jgi:hypothetical protein
MRTRGMMSDALDETDASSACVNVQRSRLACSHLQGYRKYKQTFNFVCHDAVSTSDNTFARCVELFRHTLLIPRATALHSNARASALTAVPSAEEHAIAEQAPGSRICAPSLQMPRIQIPMQHPSSSDVSDSDLHTSEMSSPLALFGCGLSCR